MQHKTSVHACNIFWQTLRSFWGCTLPAADAENGLVTQKLDTYSYSFVLLYPFLLRRVLQ